MSIFDLSSQRVITERDIEQARRAGATEIAAPERPVITPSAREAINRYNMGLRGGNGTDARNGRGNGNVAVDLPGADQAGRKKQPREKVDYDRLFHSPEAEAVKQEIVAVGRKLWQRHYVDGNGGNISYRIGPNEVICTPTLCSKGDLKAEELCMVDLEGNQLYGVRPRTSEILLHLEIYKNVPEAKGVVHCHPPHATAYAITGTVPPPGLIPEYDVFIGNVALSPYETPGTQKFAETVVPFVKQYNTVLLQNHGIVCWADTVTHAEWYAEVLETYCWTLTVAKQIGVPLTRIPSEKAEDLLAIKKKLGLPDPRFDGCELLPMPDNYGEITTPPPSPCRPLSTAPDPELESIVQGVTDAVMKAIGGKM
jgi:L-fuculose-phosphate aldolase